jgi:hypothetical protein
VGRFVAFTEMQQQLLGYNDVTTNLTFEVIESKPLELRSSTKITNRKGKLLDSSDVTMCLSDAWAMRDRYCPNRKMSRNQELTLRGSNAAYDKVSIFGLRPVELVELFPRIGEYYRWFMISKEVLDSEKIKAGLNDDIIKCQWIDGLGRRVFLRRGATEFVKARLEKMEACDLSLDSRKLRKFLLHLIKSESPSPMFIYEDSGEMLPIPVFSKVSPENSSAFIQHLMILLGEYETEMDFRDHKSIKESFAAVKLIPNEHLSNQTYLKQYSKDLLKRIICEVFNQQPITLRKMELYIIRCKRLLDSILLDDSIPITDIPSTILTELLNERHKDLDKEWKERISAQLDIMLGSLPPEVNAPSKEDIMNCNKTKPVHWDPLHSIKKSAQQSDSSYKEQRTAIDLAMKAVRNYTRQFNGVTMTKGILTHGSPGSGKSFVLMQQGLFALTQGLRVLSTALMAKRSIALGGGYHLHRLFALECCKNQNPKRLAELAIDKLHR